MDCLVFEAAGRLLGIEVRYVYRIADDARPAPAPLLPTCHAGIIYHKGDLFNVIDAGQLLGNDPSLSDKAPYVILLKWDRRKLGLIPARIVGITSIKDADAEQTVLTGEGHPVQMITPGEIWDILSGLSYGL